MNKATKGAIAAGAAGILLLGGAGTFALWQDTDSIDVGGVSTGELDLSVDAGEWANITSGTPVGIGNIANFDIVPGDTITYTVPVTITAEGDNLSGSLTVDDSALQASTGLDPVTVLNYIDVSMTNDANTVTGLTVDEETGLISFAEAGPYEINVVVTVEFDTATTNQTGQDLAVDLSALELTLAQA